ncbi:Response regulator UvrY [Thalassoglobus neptunius]|uniref:Response regulator UvrY n=1 Tax=Thalassoglobus neptunius TaxID=1938619 RepID=A0A5C5VWP0_9PLAN|nr:response regulator transcription factor [Thalassoglobus neptunius]TWT43038.1 Response regulator UvrY [Thalassoglobus neptunius]
MLQAAEQILPVQKTKTSKPIHVMMIDSSRAWLESLPLALHRFHFLRVIARATSIQECLDQIATLAPDLLLVDGRLYQDGFRELGEAFSIRTGECRVALFAQSLTDAQLQIAIHNRVHGFLSIQDTTDEIANSLETLTTTGTAISPNLRERVSTDDTGQLSVSRRTDLSGLTNRQLEVLAHLASGLRVKDIASMMKVSVKAIESHKFRIMSRLKIHDRVQLCRWAIREGLIAP